MNRYDRLHEKLRLLQKVQGSNIAAFNEPFIAQKMLRDDLDFYLLDMEHGPFNSENLTNMMAMCRALQVPAIVRVQDTAYHLIAKTLDMGADGIMLPRVETVQQMGQAIDAMQYPPIGRKGYGGLGHLRQGESLDQYKRFFFPQIESPKGIENLPDMLDQYDQYISAVIVGPSDMSIAIGTPLDLYNDNMLATVKQVFDLCRARNKSVGIYCNDATDAKLFRDLGANVLWVSGDLFFLLMGQNAVYDALATID